MFSGRSKSRLPCDQIGWPLLRTLGPTEQPGFNLSTALGLAGGGRGRQPRVTVRSLTRNASTYVLRLTRMMCQGGRADVDWQMFSALGDRADGDRRLQLFRNGAGSEDADPGRLRLHRLHT